VNKLEIIERGTGYFIINGDLTFSNIDKNTLQALPLSTSIRAITLDLNQVGLTDSAGLALMIEWIKYARKKRIQTVLKNIPEQLHNIAKLSGLDKIGFLTTHTDSII